jgi:hypothetical protein
METYCVLYIRNFSEHVDSACVNRIKLFHINFKFFFNFVIFSSVPCSLVLSCYVLLFQAEFLYLWPIIER